MNEKRKKVVICGAGGFIGGHLVADLLRQGYSDLIAVDIKPLDEWYQLFPEVENLELDLRLSDACEEAVEGAAMVFNLAADTGGVGFIENNRALCMQSVLINTHLLMACRDCGVKRYFFSSSSCVYNAEKQKNPKVIPLREEDAYPALPEDGCGWEKLFSERMCRHFLEDFELETRVARFHNVYGPISSFDGGREKAPAAICRKVVEAGIYGTNEIEIWGDGTQTRSFMYIDDCIKGAQSLMFSNFTEPLNLGSSELVSINQLVDMVEDIAGIPLKRRYNLQAPKGVTGRNSDNARILSRMGWEPSIPLRIGLEKTYAWIREQMLSRSVREGGDKLTGGMISSDAAVWKPAAAGAHL